MNQALPVIQDLRVRRVILAHMVKRVQLATLVQVVILVQKVKRVL